MHLAIQALKQRKQIFQNNKQGIVKNPNWQEAGQLVIYKG